MDATRRPNAHVHILAIAAIALALAEHGSEAIRFVTRGPGHLYIGAARLWPSPIAVRGS